MADEFNINDIANNNFSCTKVKLKEKRSAVTECVIDGIKNRKTGEERRSHQC